MVQHVLVVYMLCHDDTGHGAPVSELTEHVELCSRSIPYQPWEALRFYLHFNRLYPELPETSWEGVSQT